MKVSGLPEDLVAFIRAGRLEYDPARCEAGLVTLLPARALKVELFPMDWLTCTRSSVTACVTRPKWKPTGVIGCDEVWRRAGRTKLASARS
ncbi:MAG: hypothetical protein H0T57_13155 [Rubrobacter sp.]|nr:hypothetical protein [Rubrobacter sp.]MDQ3636414.1 hypothetical protein [Actinomycetota bacterium]